MERCRAVLVRPDSEELLARIVGQSRDVACELEVIAHDARADSGSCRELASARGAQAVLGVSKLEAGGAYEVEVCDAQTGRVQARAVPAEHASEDALGTSAAYEAVALVVRSALLDLATEHAVRVEERRQRALEAERAREAAEREAAARAAAEARARPAAEEDEPGDDERVRPDPVWLILVGGELAWIGADAPAVDLTARVLGALGPLQIGAGLAYGFSSALEAQGVELSIARHTAVLIAGVPLRLSSRVTLDAAMHAGVAALVRTTDAGSSGVMPADGATTWSAVLGVEAGASVRFAGPLGARAHLGLDAVPGAARYALENVAPSDSTSSETELGTPAHVQPRAGITLFAQF